MFRTRGWRNLGFVIGRFWLFWIFALGLGVVGLVSLLVDVIHHAGMGVAPWLVAAALGLVVCGLVAGFLKQDRRTENVELWGKAWQAWATHEVGRLSTEVRRLTADRDKYAVALAQQSAFITTNQAVANAGPTAPPGATGPTAPYEGGPQ